MVVRREHDGKPLVFGHLETLGRGGALFHCEEPIPDTSTTEVTICLAGGVIGTRARVLYHLPQEDGLRIGVEFLDLPEESRDLLDHLLSPGAPEPREPPTPRADRWPFLHFGPPVPPHLGSTNPGPDG